MSVFVAATCCKTILSGFANRCFEIEEIDTIRLQPCLSPLWDTAIAAYTLLEASDRLGGKITTERADGFIIDGGPDSFLVQKPWAWQLCREIRLWVMF